MHERPDRIDFFTPAEALHRGLLKHLSEGGDEESADRLFNAGIRTTAERLRDGIIDSTSWLAADEDARRLQFRREVREVWGRPLDLFLAMVALAEQCVAENLTSRQGDAVSAGAPLDPRVIPVTGLLARLTRIGHEVHELLTAGFPRGALARARTAHEITVYVVLLAEYGSPEGPHAELVDRFDEHSVVQRAKDAAAYQERAVEPLPNDLCARLQDQRARVVAKYGKAMNDQYGWAAPLFPGKRRLQFPDLESKAELDAVRSHYRWANHEVHATSRSLALNTTFEDNGMHRFGIGREMTGLADPCLVVARSIVRGLASLLIDTEVFSPA